MDAIPFGGGTMRLEIAENKREGSGEVRKSGTEMKSRQ